ncbi:hypothetical protein GCM10027176_17510 [Actinoallomurus bryophytorum]
MTFPAREPCGGAGVDAAAAAEVVTADGGVADAAEPSPDPQPQRSPAAAVIAKAPKVLRPECVIREGITAQCAKHLRQLCPEGGKALLHRRSRPRTRPRTYGPTYGKVTAAALSALSCGDDGHAWDPAAAGYR